jgi:formylglycine-generating enzyme required for sulfatase activity
MAEWTLDSFRRPYPETCVDCVDDRDPNAKVTRGGAFSTAPDALTTSFRGPIESIQRYDGHGGRCAHRR